MDSQMGHCVYGDWHHEIRQNLTKTTILWSSSMHGVAGSVLVLCPATGLLAALISTCMFSRLPPHFHPYLPNSKNKPGIKTTFNFVLVCWYCWVLIINYLIKAGSRWDAFCDIFLFRGHFTCITICIISPAKYCNMYWYASSCIITPIAVSYTLYVGVAANQGLSTLDLKTQLVWMTSCLPLWRTPHECARQNFCLR